MNILVASDLSEAAAPVVQAARTFALSSAANLWLVHVAEPEPDFVGFDAGPVTVRHDMASKFRDAHRRLQQCAEEFRQAGINATPLLLQGPIAVTLLHEAERIHADMIIMGSHGHGKVYHLLVGSATEDVLKKAKCPVLVVPTHRRAP